MKKKNLKTLKLNKNRISDFQIKGGLPPASLDYSNCPVCEPIPVHTNECEPIRWLTEHNGFICRTWN